MTSDGSLGFKTYLCTLGIPWSTFVYWLTKYQQLKEDYEEAKLLLGENIEAKALKRQFDPNFAKFLLFNYLPEYKETQKFLSSLKDLGAEESRTKIVLIENFGEALENLKNKANDNHEALINVSSAH